MRINKLYSGHQNTGCHDEWEIPHQKQSTTTSSPYLNLLCHWHEKRQGSNNFVLPKGTTHGLQNLSNINPGTLNICFTIASNILLALPKKVFSMSFGISKRIFIYPSPIIDSQIKNLFNIELCYHLLSEWFWPTCLLLLHQLNPDSPSHWVCSLIWKVTQGSGLNNRNNWDETNIKGCKKWTTHNCDEKQVLKQVMDR